jgi:aspartyl protease family protein
MLGGVYFLMAVILILGTWMSRREPWAKMATMALTWSAIFAAGFVLLTFRDNFGWVAQPAHDLDKALKRHGRLGRGD